MRIRIRIEQVRIGAEQCDHHSHSTLTCAVPLLLRLDVSFFSMLGVLAVLVLGVAAVRPVPTHAQPALGAHAGTERDGFYRIHWYRRGSEHGNPKFNDRFRVNAPKASLHPTVGDRPEARGNGLMQIRMDEDPRSIRGAALFLELWGGHPGTARKRVTVNGRSTYSIPPVGTEAGHVTHQYPTLPLDRSDLVRGHNAFQFACDQGEAFWGHYIVDEAALTTELARDHPAIDSAGLSEFRAEVRPERHPSDERVHLHLDVPNGWDSRIERVTFYGRYEGYDENGNRRSRDWHGFTKEKQPAGHLGTSEEAPYRTEWDLSMLPGQRQVAVRAVLELSGDSDLRYVTELRGDLSIPERSDHQVRLHRVRKIPKPFWARAGERKTAVFDLDVPPHRIVSAELHVTVWDGGAGTVEDYFTLNSLAFEVAGRGDHRVHYTRSDVPADLLRKGPNRLELHSDTRHHGIELLLPGPVLVVRSRTAP